MKTALNYLINLLFFFIPIVQLPSLYLIRHEIKIGIMIMILIISLLSFRQKKVNITNNKYLLFQVLIFYIFILIMSLYKFEYINSIYFYSLNLSIFFVFFGRLLNLNIQITEKIKYYLLGVLILSLDIYVNYFINIDLYNTTYIFKLKNEAGPLIAMSIIVSQFFKNKYKHKYAFLINLSDVFKFLLLTLLKNRTGILSLIISFLALLCFKKKFITKHILKKIYVLLICFFTILFYNFSKIINYIKWSSGITHKRIGVNFLDRISSDRYSIYLETINTISENFIFGKGNAYVDNLYLGILVNYGIIGFIILFPLFIWVYNLYKNKNKSYLRNLIKLLIIYAFITTFLEALPPFGPGTSFFIFWFLIGTESGMIKNKHKN